MFRPRREDKNEDDVPDFTTDFSLEDESELNDEEAIIEVGSDHRRYEAEELRRQGYGDNGLDLDLYQSASES